MYSHFNNSIGANICRCGMAGLIMITLLLIITPSHAQTYPLRVNLVVSPPYSPKISEYTSNPNKILATIQYLPGTGSRTLQVYLTGEISGSSGIRIYTRPGHRPPQPLNLMPGSVYRLNLNNIQDIFSTSQLAYEGITEQEIISGNGLPEDDYTICLRAYEYTTNQPLSDEDPSGCCPPFPVTSIEPPIITQPFCGDEITATSPQNLIISWTRPAGAPITTRYKLQMIEVVPGTHNIQNAFNSAAQPIFFETTINTTAYVYGPAQPALVKGKTYAFAVTAFDPARHHNFRNSGRSEVCSFIWKSGGSLFPGMDIGMITDEPAVNPVNIGGVGFNAPIPLLPSKVSGKLVYRYSDPGDNEKFPLAAATIKLVVGHAKVSKGQPLLPEKVVGHFTQPHDYCNDPEIGRVLGVATTDSEGNFVFNLMNGVEFGKRCWVGGELGYDYYRVAFIVIEAPHRNYYFNPSVMLQPEQGKDLIAGDVIARVRSYQLTVNAMADPNLSTNLSKAIGTNILSTINVYLLRKLDFSYQLFPLNDGKIKGQSHQVDESVRNKFPGFTVVAHGTTGSDGTLTFQRVVWHHQSQYQYYLMADCPPDADMNYYFGAPKAWSPPQTIPSKDGFGTIDPSIIEFPWYYDYNKAKQSKVLHLWPQWPKVAGTVSENENTDPIIGAKVDLNETYNLSPKNNLQIFYPYWMYNENQPMVNCLQNNCGQYFNSLMAITAADGKFVFDDLSMVYNTQSNSVTGPNRHLLVSKDGYQTYEEAIGPIMYGRQVIKNELKLRKGAILKGYVRDAENNQPLSAQLSLPGGKTYNSKQSNGAFEMPVPLLPGVTQKVIVKRSGYITDTIEFEASKPINHHDIKIYTLKRRLLVIVKTTGHSIPLPVSNALVNIMNVTTNINGHNYPIGEFTDVDGVARLSFVNGGTNNELNYDIRVGMPPNTDRNFEAWHKTIKIPYSQQPTILHVTLRRAACIKGHVYAGSGTESPVSIANVRYFNSGNYFQEGYTLSSQSGADGYYYMNNFPVRNYAQKVTASKSQSNYIGDEKTILINSPSNECVTVNFNLTVYEDMDITNLMGFPMEVTRLTEEDNKTVRINGNLTNIRNNDQFSADAGLVIPFTGIAIKAGSRKNSSGVPIAEPVSLPVATTKSNLQNITVLKTFTGSVYKSGGITIDRESTSSVWGNITGRVKIEPTEFNNTMSALPPIGLAISAAPGLEKMNMPVFAANPAKVKPVQLPATGFFVCGLNGEALKYSLPAFENSASAEIAKSYLNNGKLLLTTTLHTQCSNIAPADLKIQLGVVEISKTNFAFNGKNPIIFNMNQWKLTSQKWSLDNLGIKIDQAIIKASGLDIPLKNLVITRDAIDHSNTIAELSGLKILGTLPVDVTTKNQGLNYYDIGSGNMQWVLYATPDGGPQTAMITGLPGLPGQKLPLNGIRILSDGSQPRFEPLAQDLKLYDIVDFRPGSGSILFIANSASPPFFKVLGTYKTGIPYIEEFGGNMSWQKQSSGMKFVVDNPNQFNFTHNNMAFIWDLQSLKISPQLFTAQGTATEEGKLGPVRIELVHKHATTEIDIPYDEKIYITQDQTKYFEKVIGGMEVNKSQHTWNNFWFEGEMAGMNGISNNAQKSRLKFICQGDISASGESINVSKLDDFPGMTFTYDIANSRLTASMQIDKNISGMQANGTANCIFDPNGWYLNINGNLTIPGIGGCKLYGLFGDYLAVPPDLATPFGALKCIPSAFQNKVSGFLLQGTLTKQLIPSIEWGVTLPLIDTYVGVQIYADLSMNARTWMSFDPQVNNYGISLLAEGNIGGGASSGIFALSTNANAQLGISGTYFSNGSYSVEGCGSVQAGVSAQVFYGAAWVGVDLTSPSLGLMMSINDNDWKFKLLLGSCGENLCP
ncbi:MAG: hypothetical protein CVT94_10295 [Bacteroidetes bacterium HGW-Bacteroidetes-11]|nr:MAG: hypothetical protein CVT94_10295 [Bacteroidetes bacterium HGW-Bacteroidetes-11]